MVGNLKKITVFFKFPTVFLRKKKEKVRVGEGKFLTFVFFLEENRRIGNKKYKNEKLQKYPHQPSPFCVRRR